MRTVWTWLAIGGALLAMYFAQTVFGLTGSQLTTILLFVGLLALSYQVNTLKEANPKLKKKFVNDLLFSEPIAVKHDRPKSLTPDGKESWGAERHDFECFQSFWYFADWINKLYSDLSEPIRLQELGDTSILGSLSREAPAYGRRYDIFYNQVKIGLLQIRAGLDYPEDKSVDVQISIDRIPPTVLPYSNVYGFLQTVASLVASTKRPKYAHLPNGKTEYEEALSAINYQLAEAMWNTLSNYTLGEPAWTELEVRLSGTPDRYYQMETRERATRMQARADQASNRRSA